MPVFIVSDHEPTSLKIQEVLNFSGKDCPSSHLLTFDAAPFRLSREQPELVIVVLPPDFERGLNILSVMRSLSQCRVLAVGPASDSKLVLRALRNGADDYVDGDDLEPELASALNRLESAGSERKEPARLISLLSPNGGSGSSTLAANIATALAKEHQSVCLIDMKLESGDLSALLDLRPAFTLAEICQNASRLDRVMFERSLVRHASGVHLLAPPRLLADISHVSAEGVGQAILQARALFPYVLADLDHTFREEQNVVLRQSDLVLVVFRLDFASLRNTRRTLEHLEHMEISRERVRLVVNRYGQPKEVPASKAEEALGMKVFHYVPDDAHTINRSNNNGVPFVLEAPSARVSRSVSRLAMSVNGMHKSD
jgi:pilus assembly protein CpaE